MFTGKLAGWVRALPDIAARLDVGTARVLDIGCGMGWSSIMLARAFPGIAVHGVDLDEASIAEARDHATAAGVTDRVTFEVCDAADLVVSASVDLTCVFEALHDIGRSVEVPRQVRTALASGAAVLIGDERFMYGLERAALPAGNHRRAGRGDRHRAAGVHCARLDPRCGLRRGRNPGH